MPRLGHCYIADMNCTAPAGIGVQGLGYANCDPQPITHCIRCGDDVCTSCSVRMTIRRQRGRYCYSCIEGALGEEGLRQKIEEE